MSSRAPILIALPSGLIVSGVATWAARLTSALAATGRRAGLILHTPPPGHERLDIELHPDVRVFDLSHLPRFEDLAPACGARSPVDVAAAREAWTRAYLDAARSLARTTPGDPPSPVVLSPNLHADCYAVALEAARREPDLIRLVGWQHNDIEYDRRVLDHYEPALAAIAGVSDHIVSLLRTLLPERAICPIPYGVEVPATPPQREPPTTARGTRPVRLLYTGRLDHNQKRILALPHLSAALTDLGIEHELTILGDGPAAFDLDHLIDDLARRPAAPEPVSPGAAPRTKTLHHGDITLAPDSATAVHPLRPGSETLARINRLGAASPAQVRAALATHDAFLLPSRFEGLSVSMLEALAAGCVPIVARVASGALQAIEPGISGLIADVEPDADEVAVGRALAVEVARFLASDTPRMAARAWTTARDSYSIDIHARLAERLIDTAAARPPVAWPRDRRPWFSDLGASIPADAPECIARALAPLAGRRLVVHGAGLHTRTLLAHLLAGPATILAFADDDRQRHGELLGDLPIIAPAEAAARGATHVLISTHMHEAAVWSRRDIYERQGLIVLRLYA